MASKRGFAAMSREKQREIASKGGKASHKNRKSKVKSEKGGQMGGVSSYSDLDEGGTY